MPLYTTTTINLWMNALECNVCAFTQFSGVQCFYILFLFVLMPKVLEVMWLWGLCPCCPIVCMLHFSHIVTGGGGKSIICEDLGPPGRWSSSLLGTAGTSEATASSTGRSSTYLCSLSGKRFGWLVTPSSFSNLGGMSSSGCVHSSSRGVLVHIGFIISGWCGLGCYSSALCSSSYCSTSATSFRILSFRIHSFPCSWLYWYFQWQVDTWKEKITM